MFAQKQQSFVLIMVLLAGIFGVIPAQTTSVPLQPAALEYVPLPLPAGWDQGRLMDVWGFSTTDVYVVGFGLDASRNTVPLIYHHDGTGWIPAR